MLRGLILLFITFLLLVHSCEVSTKLSRIEKKVDLIVPIAEALK